MNRDVCSALTNLMLSFDSTTWNRKLLGYSPEAANSIKDLFLFEPLLMAKESLFCLMMPLEHIDFNIGYWISGIWSV